MEKLEINDVLQSVPGCIYWKDVNGVYLGCNQAEAELLGFNSTQEVIGKTDRDLLSDKEVDMLIKTDKRIMQAGLPEEIIETYTLINGKVLEVLTRKSPLHDRKGNVIGIIGVSIDIAVRKAEEEKEKILRTQLYVNRILQHLPGCVYWKDINGVYLGCNQMEAELLGLNSPEDVIGKVDHDLSWKYEADVLRETDRRIMQNRSAEEIIERVTVGDGKNAVVLTRKCPLYDDKGNVTGIIGVSIDITDRKKNEELRRELEMQKELFNVTMEIAHDIVSPITSLKVAQDILGNKMSKQEAAILDLAIESIEDMSNKLARKYKKRLDQKNEQVVLEENYVEVDKSLQDIVISHRYRYRNGDKKIEFKYETDEKHKPVLIKGNRSDFRRMITNLIKNGVEAIERDNGEVETSLRVKDGLVEIMVKDNGEGMSREMADKIMNNEAVGTTKETGHGIGMQQITGTLRAMKGEMEIKTQGGVGTKFILRFTRIEKPT